jgi:exopolysaccharide biosynthesis WecB/TagA/CpsF family protein
LESNIKYFDGFPLLVKEDLENSLLEYNNPDYQILLTYLNTYTYVEYKKIKLVNTSLPLYFIPDGIGIHLALKLFGVSNKKLNDRSVSTDLWDDILFLLNKDYIKCSIWGGQKNYSEFVFEYFNKKFPNINVASIIDGYSPININENKYNDVNLLIVGTGTPNQEEWIINNYNKLKIPIIILVGSAIDFWSGAKKRAPLWIQKIGLEWLYRLFQEPKRLWKRYIIGIPVFMFNIILIKVKLMLKKEST